MDENTRNKFKEQITCSICLDIYNDPRVLPCPQPHSFCRSCLEGMPLVNRKINCPICRHEFTVTSGIASLPRDHRILTLIDLYVYNSYVFKFFF